MMTLEEAFKELNKINDDSLNEGLFNVGDRVKVVRGKGYPEAILGTGVVGTVKDNADSKIIGVFFNDKKYYGIIDCSSADLQKV